MRERFGDWKHVTMLTQTLNTDEAQIKLINALALSGAAVNSH